jgi:charged multivesicular body protein 2A
MKSQQSMATALVGVTRTMKSMNTALKLNSLQKVASDFERMIEVQGIKQEMFSESIDQVLSSEYEAQEADELVNKIYDEVGLSFSEKLASTPASGRIAVETDKVSLAADDVDLLSRLESLRKL